MSIFLVLAFLPTMAHADHCRTGSAKTRIKCLNTEMIVLHKMVLELKTALERKADTSLLEQKADKSELALKADSSAVPTMVDAQLAAKSVMMWGQHGRLKSLVHTPPGAGYCLDHDTGNAGHIQGFQCSENPQGQNWIFEGPH
jgi:hypothetical protein